MRGRSPGPWCAARFLSSACKQPTRPAGQGGATSAPSGSRVAPDALLLARIAFSDEFDEGTRMNAGRELLRLGYNLAVLRRIVERGG